jgi:eukaryotic-like serine/threonine-protein kinase
VTPDRSRVEELFEAALDVDEVARLDFVAAACAGDEAMRKAVLALLSAHARTGGILDGQPYSAMPAARLPAPPARLGVYRLLSEIGRGGMGVVYDAERDDGQFRRRVAIKIMRDDGDPELRQRVLSERQILAALDHPDIARLLDGGVTDDGRPYLVMEHVDGLPIDVYCDRLRLTVRERLVLFCAMARAVEYAHRNLVVHRDLKPSNILVTPDGRLKLLDFGVAKLLNPWVHGEAPPVTRDRLALTPEYASPEQLRGEPVTTSSDVYSLGVVLYELLTGRRPFADREASPADHIAAVCGMDPAPASERVARREYIMASGASVRRELDPAAIAVSRQSTPQRLARELRGDVDAILGVALCTETSRRYGSAELLAQDVERHLTHQRVVAHHGSRTYALRKAMRRHRVPAAALALAVLSLLAGATVAVWQAASAMRERNRAETALAQSEQVSGFMLDLFDRDPGSSGMVPAVTARELVRRGVTRIESLSDQPQLQARLLGAMSRIHEALGDYDDAQLEARRALDLLSASGDGESVAAADLMLDIGWLQLRRSIYDSAQATTQAAFELQQRVGAGPPARWRAYHQLASIAVYHGDLAAAQRHADDGYAMQLAAFGDGQRETINALLLVGTLQWRRADFDAAERTLRRVIELRQHDPASSRADRLTDRLQLTNVLMAQPHRMAEAEPILRSIIAELAEDDIQHNSHLIWARYSLATLLDEQGNRAEATRIREENVPTTGGTHALEARSHVLCVPEAGHGSAGGEAGVRRAAEPRR